MKEFMYILDFNTASVYRIDITNDNREAEDILNDHGLNIDECQFMTTSNDITEIKTL